MGNNASEPSAGADQAASSNTLQVGDGGLGRSRSSRRGSSIRRRTTSAGRDDSKERKDLGASPSPSKMDSRDAGVGASPGLRRKKSVVKQGDLRANASKNSKKIMGSGLMRVVMGGGIRYGLLMDRTRNKGKSKGKLVIFWAGKLPDDTGPMDSGKDSRRKSRDHLPVIDSKPDGDAIDPNDIALFDVAKTVALYNTHTKDLRMTITPDNARIEGFLDIHLNLLNPISVRKSKRQGGVKDTNAVYLNDMTKRLHIDSSTTALDIITTLMERYGVSEDPRNFALFESKGERWGLGGRRLADEEQPLLLQLVWGPMTTRSLSLQEARRSKTGGTIQWEFFSLPELQNFLVMLEREENNHMEAIKLIYQEKRKRLERYLERAEEKESDAAE